MDTFFFGYLPLKWKRLARVLSFLLYVVLSILAFEGEFQSFKFGSLNYMNVIVIFGTPFFVFILSWIVKPFVVKEK
ncbi:MAG: hypothetical protein HOM09_04570 [Flavobacteriaceae bacterium]|jgi:hypothetical protein|nr:hypothetical protein [Flavobacteriaceae bacterium]|tara:strand:+ start:292 stop:519 length:228 start_codon:yes stop_codon:yes gene_type:complete